MGHLVRILFNRYLFLTIPRHFLNVKLCLGFHLLVFSSWSPRKSSRRSRSLRLLVHWENTLWLFFWVFLFTVLEPSHLFSSWPFENCHTNTFLKCRKFWQQLSVLVQVQQQCQSPSIVLTTWASIHVSHVLSFLSALQSTWTVNNFSFF